MDVRRQCQVGMDLVTQYERAVSLCQKGYLSQFFNAPDTSTGVVWIAEDEDLDIGQVSVKLIEVDGVLMGVLIELQVVVNHIASVMFGNEEEGVIDRVHHQHLVAWLCEDLQSKGDAANNAGNEGQLGFSYFPVLLLPEPLDNGRTPARIGGCIS